LILTEEGCCCSQLIQPRSSAYRCRKSGSTERKNFDRKASCKRKGSGKVVADKKEVKAVIETKSRLKSQEKEAVASEEKSPKAGDPAEEGLLLSIKIVGN
jgi:hypothetical protein